MPAILQSDSEYQRHYKWNASRKSRSYSPPLEALKPAAGVRSEIAAKGSEPAITSKKKVCAPKPTSTTKFEMEADDYMLLGHNDKFAPNIKYRSKSRDRALNIKKSRKPEIDEEHTIPETPRDPPPAPRVIYDTGAPKPKIKKAAEPAKVTKSVEVQNGKHVPDKPILRPPPQPEVRSKNVKPVKSQSEPVVRESRQPRQQQPAKQAKPSKSQTQARPVERRERRKGQLNEFAQTDMARGVAHSGQEAPADYAMKYQKGIAPPRSKAPKRQSEYEMQFKWRKGVPSSPMLDAEQLVYKNNPQAPPFRPDTMAKASEYKAQFQAWQMMKSTPNLAQAVKQEEGRNVKKAIKHKRSRSLEDLTPDQRPAAGVEAGVSPEDKRLIKESLNPQRLHFPHGKPKRVRSEYASNFAAPQKFDYDMGAWRGADPPQIMNRPDTGSLISQDGEARSSTWFGEVIELRRKAEEYKKRAQGTHFSREHVAQLYARQADLWDTASTEGSIVTALSLESASQASSVRVKKSRDNVGRSLQLDVDELSSPHMGTVTPQSERTLTPDVEEIGLDEVDDDDVTVSYGTSARSVDLTPGRVPTPQLRGRTYIKTRHHLDRTTPSVGGAILTSPQVHNNQESQDSRPSGVRPVKTKPVEAWVESPGNVVRESFSVPGHLQLGRTKSPAFGKPTEDSHVLVDEDTASDHTLRLDFVKSKPELDQAKQDFATRLSTIKEASGEYRSTGRSSDIGAMTAPAVTIGNLRQSSSLTPTRQLQKPKMSQQMLGGERETKAVQSVGRSQELIHQGTVVEGATTASRCIPSVLKKSDIQELKSLCAPPVQVKMVMEAVCILLGVKPEYRDDPKNPGNKVADYFPAAKRTFADSEFLTVLRKYDSDNIPESVMTKIRNDYCNNPDFTPEKVGTASAAAVGLCKWVLSIEQYDRMRKGRVKVTRQSVQPKNKQQVSSTHDRGNLAEAISRTTGEVEQLRALVRDIELAVSDQASIVQAIKQDKAGAMPALEAATKALDCLSKGDITELKAFSKPPQGVKFVLEAVCILLGIKPEILPDPNIPGRKDYWRSCQKMLGDSRFLSRLQNFDKDNIPHDVMSKIRTEYCNHPDYTVEHINSISKAAVNLYRWVLNIEAYDRIIKVIGPKIKNLRHAEQVLEGRRQKMNDKRAQLRALEQKLTSLKRQYSKAIGDGRTEHQNSSHSTPRKQNGQVQLNGHKEYCPGLDLGKMHSGEDDDVMSLSARSIASSCSLASDVLERAKNRRDVFWQ